jgi:hypothetical protein
MSNRTEMAGGTSGVAGTGTCKDCALERVKGGADCAARSASSMVSSLCIACTSLCVNEADTRQVGSLIGN